jgi:predicted nucleic acid-binding Zn ribbon protein
MKSLKQLIPSILRQLPDDPETRLVFLQNLWPRIVGPEVSGKCRPEDLQGSRLIIHTSSDQWRLSLQEMRGLLVASINRFWPNSGINHISVQNHPKGHPKE